MTCRAARRLLPLFAGGDLKAAELSAVAGHVAACAACQAEVEAFTAALSLLPLSSLSFGESERAVIRRRVLDEIAEWGSQSPSIAFLFRPRFALVALAGAIVLAVSLVSPFFVRNAGGPAVVLPARPAPTTTSLPAREHIAEVVPELPDRSRAVRASRERSEKSPARPPSRTAEESGPAMRFEIQTGNVNVRIIWFTGGTRGEEPSSPPAGDPNDVS